MMDQTHIGYTSWQEPRHNIPPHTDTIDLATATGPTWGVDTASAADHYIDIYNRRSTPFSYTIEADAPWIGLSSTGGTIDKEQRIWFAIRGNRTLPTAKNATITITGPDKQQTQVSIRFAQPSPQPPKTFKGFLETNGCIAVEAEHFSSQTSTSSIHWTVIPDLGRTLSGVEATPVTAAPQTPGEKTPHLEYDVWLTDTGDIHVRTYCSPIIAFNGKPIRFAIAFDNEEPQLIDLTTGSEARGGWNKMVADNIRIANSTHAIHQPGRHTLKFFLVDPGVVLQRLVIDAGGVKPSYLGPPESPRSNDSPATAYQDYLPIAVAVSPRSTASPGSATIR